MNSLIIVSYFEVLTKKKLQENLEAAKTLLLISILIGCELARTTLRMDNITLTETYFDKLPASLLPAKKKKKLHTMVPPRHLICLKCCLNGMSLLWGSLCHPVPTPAGRVDSTLGGTSLWDLSK